jgi:hypothetical protein
VGGSGNLSLALKMLVMFRVFTLVMMVMNVVRKCRGDVGGQIMSVVTHQYMVIGLSSVHLNLSEDRRAVGCKPLW